MEAEELRNLKQSHLNKIEEIKREHVLALEPVIARLNVSENHLQLIFLTFLRECSLMSNWLCLLSAARNQNGRRRNEGKKKDYGTECQGGVATHVYLGHPNLIVAKSYSDYFLELCFVYIIAYGVSSSKQKSLILELFEFLC